MINHTELTAGKGRFKVTLFLQETGGHGLCCFLTGGERPHVGGTVLASLSERVNGGGMTCNLWNIPLPGHKDSYLAEKLAKMVKDKPYFEHVHYYVVDEFWYAKEPGTQDMDIPVNKMSMDLKFFQAASIPEERIHTLRDETVDSFDAAIQQIGGMDMVLMGIGTDGHF